MPNLYDDVQAEWPHHITQALRAHHLYKSDVHYVTKDGEVIIVDEFTGRLMPGRRWSDGLHQAIEAKENQRIKEENQTLATITFQNFFKLYEKRSGMTGTAMTEATELWSIYKLDVVEIPTNKRMARTDFADQVFRTEREKNAAIVKEIEDCWKRGQPVLVGTRSIEKSEKLSGMLRHKGIPHHVLNAKYHEMEAQIIAQAGKKAAVTIATNMAGRGTDIVLGGNPTDAEEQKQVVTAGGLHILGSERHESRRIDNQLRGRSGRQGDPGSSRFYVALDDELMRLFGSDRISGILERLGMEEGEVIEHPWVTKAIGNAQRKVEMYHFDIRKQLLEYDNVMNKQREAIYALRNTILDGNDVTGQIEAMIEETLEYHRDLWCPAKTHPEHWQAESMAAWLKRSFKLETGPQHILSQTTESLSELLASETTSIRAARQGAFAQAEISHQEIERTLLLQVLDIAWKDHLYELDHLKEGIGLRAYGQKDPLIEYQKESFRMFEEMMDRIRDETVEFLFRIPLPQEMQRQEQQKTAPLVSMAQVSRKDKSGIGRNDPCPCGSGKKYKRCCGSGA